MGSLLSRTPITDALRLAAKDGYVTISIEGRLTISYALECGGMGSLGSYGGTRMEGIFLSALFRSIPIFDFRTALWENAVAFVVRGPMIGAAGHKPDALPRDGRWRSLNYAPLPAYAALARAAGVTVHNA